MPIVSRRSETVQQRTAFSLLRRAQASIAGYLNYGYGDLAKYLDRKAFCEMALRLANHYFHRSKDLAIHAQVVDLYHALLIMAPILQRLPLSSKFDWHRGHILSHFRRNASSRVGRCHCAIREVERSYRPDLLAANMEALGLHDAAMQEVLLDLYRRHAGGTALKDILAHQLFDPILMATMKQGYELRHGNRFIRMERESFKGAVDLRCRQVTVLDYSLQLMEHRGGRHLEIRISEECLAGFRQQISKLVALSASPELKLINIENRLRDFVESTKQARSALPQIMELKTWLATKLCRLAGTSTEAKVLPNLLVNLWLLRSDCRLLFKKEQNFFFDPQAHDMSTFIIFCSPYRET